MLIKRLLASGVCVWIASSFCAPLFAGENNWMYVCSGKDSNGDLVRIESIRILDETSIRLMSYQNLTKTKPGFGTPQDPFVFLSGRYFVKPDSLNHLYTGFNIGKRFTIDLRMRTNPKTWPVDEKPKQPNASAEFRLQASKREDSEIIQMSRTSLQCHTRKGGE